jgi:hypothetical protein
VPPTYVCLFSDYDDLVVSGSCLIQQVANSPSAGASVVRLACVLSTGDRKGDHVRMDRAIPPWPTEELAVSGPATALQTSKLLATERLWIRRRVEQFTFVDGVRVRRSMSIDFFTPSDTVATEGTGVFLAPLALPKKAPLLNLDAVDEDGRSLPVLTLDENGAIASELLRRLATELVLVTKRFGDLDQDVALDLHDIAGAGYGEADRPSRAERRARVGRAIQAFREAYSVTAPPTEADQQRQLLWGSLALRPFLDLLADRFILFVRLHAQPSDRRIVKLSYEERVQREAERRGFSGLLKTLWRNRKETLGRAPYQFSIPTRALYAASSYHVEIPVPEELLIARAELGRAVQYVDVRDGTEKPGGRVEADTRRNVPRAHLTSPGLQPGSSTQPAPLRHEPLEIGYVDIDLKLRPGPVFTLFVISFVITAMLVLGLCLRAAGVHVDRATGAPVLIAAPGVFAAYLVPGGEPLSRRMFAGLRLLAGGSALIAFAASGSLALSLPTWGTVLAWVLLALASATSTRVFYKAVKYSVIT